MKSENKLVCKICNNSKNNKTYKVKEMMFGFKGQFLYFECSKCGCLQIKKFPPNISKYYPSNYYSLSIDPRSYFKNPFMNMVKKIKNTFIVFDKGFIGKVISSNFPFESLRSLSMIDLTKDSRILDVGCGNGYLLYNLREIGFKNVLGIDPYINEDIKYKNGLVILKESLSNINGKWDVVMFHHSFEHMENPLQILSIVSKLLDKHGVCIIRIPTVSSYSWRHYHENWVELDAPRHFFLHSTKSIMLLAKKSNLGLNKVVYDSTEFELWGSEQYLKGIPLRSDNSYGENPSNSIFSKRDINVFKRRVKMLNAKREGGRAAFYLIKI